MERSPLTPPSIDPAVVNWLEKVFPNRAPRIQMSEKEVWFTAGQAHVVEFLREHLKRQSENLLGN